MTPENAGPPLSNRGQTKYDLEDYTGAISDLTKSIEIIPNNGWAYYIRGLSKQKIEDLNSACTDWKKAAELGETIAAELVTNNCN